MLEDPYLNALRAVFGYALTCHKAQGGEWNHVYLDIPKSVPVLHKPYVYQWIYTAMTRAKLELYIVDDFWVM
jgi:ATP-dependent exoDNAse (exonuclease V) alpha subunit